MTTLKADKHIEVELKMDELDLTAAESKATYEEIKGHIRAKSETAKQPQCPPEQEKLIEEALRYFKMIS